MIMNRAPEDSKSCNNPRPPSACLLGFLDDKLGQPEQLHLALAVLEHLRVTTRWQAMQ